MTHEQLLKSTHTFQKQESSGIGVVCRRSEHDAHRTTTLDCSRSSGVEVVPNSRVCMWAPSVSTTPRIILQEMTILEHHHDDWPATETTRPPRLHGQSRFVALTRRNMRALEGPPATLFISSWPPSRHSRACMCIWVQGLRRREGGGTDLTPYRTPSGSYAGRSALGMGRLALFLTRVGDG